MSKVFDRVRNVLVQALNVEEDEVTLSSSLYNDLGAESIDMLDITFRLEREFNINIDEDQLFPRSIFNGDETCVKNGEITAKGLNVIKEAVPHGDFTKFGNPPKVAEIASIFTVNTLVKYLESKGV